MLNAEVVDFIVALIMGWSEQQIDRKERGGSFPTIAATYSPLFI